MSWISYKLPGGGYNELYIDTSKIPLQHHAMPRPVAFGY